MDECQVDVLQFIPRIRKRMKFNPVSVNCMPSDSELVPFKATDRIQQGRLSGAMSSRYRPMGRDQRGNTNLVVESGVQEKKLGEKLFLYPVQGIRLVVANDNGLGGCQGKTGKNADQQ